MSEETQGRPTLCHPQPTDPHSQAFLLDQPFGEEFLHTLIHTRSEPIPFLKQGWGHLGDIERLGVRTVNCDSFPLGPPPSQWPGLSTSQSWGLCTMLDLNLHCCHSAPTQFGECYILNHLAVTRQTPTGHTFQYATPSIPTVPCSTLTLHLHTTPPGLSPAGSVAPLLRQTLRGPPASSSSPSASAHYPCQYPTHTYIHPLVHSRRRSVPRPSCPMFSSNLMRGRARQTPLSHIIP